MKKIYTQFNKFLLIGIFVFLAGSVLAQPYTSFQSGLASEPGTWVDGSTNPNDVPPIFGGTGGAGDVAINHNVAYNTAVSIPTGQTFEITSTGVYLGTSLTFTNAPTSYLIVDGVLTLIGVLTNVKNGKTVVSGDGVILAIGIAEEGSIPASIDYKVLAKTWNGNVDTDWSTSGNWSDNAVPTASDDVAINNTVTNNPVISDDASANRIIMNGSLTVASAGSLTVDSVYNIGGAVTIQSTSANATGSLRANYFEGSGTVNVERRIPSTNWHMISSPVVGQQMGAFVTANSLRENPNVTGEFALAPYAEGTNSWSPFTSNTETAEFNVAQGYMASASGGGAATFSGTGINTGDQSVGIVRTGDGGWNAVGNPYTSSIIASGSASFLEANSASLDPSYQGIYIWDHSLGTTGEYTVISDGNYIFPGPGGETQLIQTLLALGQGFIIKAAATGSVSFSPLMQTPDNSTLFKAAEISVPALRLTVNSGNLVNNTILAFENEASHGLDPGFDVGKLKGNPGIALYSQLLDGSSDVDFAVQSLLNESFDMQTIPIGLDLPNGGDATFSLETVSFPKEALVYLEDSELGTKTQLNLEDAEYTVQLESTDGYGRFNLIVENYTKSGQIATSIHPAIQEDSEFKVFISNKQIVVNGPTDENTSIAVYGIDGRMRYQNRAENANMNKIDASSYPAGIYVVRINKPGAVESRKVILTNR